MRHVLFLVSFLLFHAQYTCAHVLKPGFDKYEYMEMLKIAQLQHTELAKWNNEKNIPPPQQYRFAYRSPVVGLDNMWDMWIRKDKQVAVISVRGTTVNAVSWLANMYAAMVPAKGKLQLEPNWTFNYNLSDNPQAAVHIGWLVGTAYLSQDIIPRIDSCYKLGIKDFIITGHSQGGAITILLTSYLENLKTTGTLPRDIRFKTYSSAAPKPGNLFYAYDYEHMTQGGWAFNAVNSTDWVAEVPFSIQTVSDFNKINPFVNARQMIRKQKFPMNFALRHMYNKLSKPARKAQRNYEKYLGKMVSKYVRKNLPGYIAPDYYQSNNYVRTGATIVLYADSGYYQKYPQTNREQIFQNHFIGPYLYLAEKLP